MLETYVIAEIGNNHNGLVRKAKQLIDVAARAGADAVKFQTFRGLDIVHPNLPANAYPGWKVEGFEYWYQFLDSIALPLESHQEIIDYTHSLKLDFITTPVSPDIVSILETMKGIDAYKLASMDLNNLGLIKALAGTKKPVIISTGMGNLQEVHEAVKYFDKGRVRILHCVSDYPLNPVNAALGNINVLKTNFPETAIGFSDHSLGHELVIAAMALGAHIIEKHITLDRHDPQLAEHHFALEPKELEEMIHWIRVMDQNLSKTEWVRSPNESGARLNVRRSFHYKHDLPAGAVLKESDLVFIRPGDGIDYHQLDQILGQKINGPRKAYAPCMVSDIEEAT